MLDEVIYNSNAYKHRMEDADRLLLYNPRTGGMFFVQGKTRKKLMEIIEHSTYYTVDISDKHIQYLLSHKILLRKDRSQ